MIEKCCMNCEYYYANPYLKSICTIDNTQIDVEISHIAKCKSGFSPWWGIVE